MESAWLTAREGTKRLGRAMAAAPRTPPAPAVTPATSSPPPGDLLETTFILKLHSVFRTLIFRFYIFATYQDNYRTYFKISGPSYILWAIENYAECCKIADQIAAKEVEEEEEEVTMDDGQKMDEIIRYIRCLRKPSNLNMSLKI